MNKNKLICTLLCFIILAACAPSMDREIELDGTRWKLQNMDGQELLAKTSITLKFGDSEITGWAGCNSYGAEYTIQPKNGFAIHSINQTAEGCIEPEGVMRQEEQYSQKLLDVISYRVESGGLVLLDEQGLILLQYGQMPEFNVKSEYLVGRMWQMRSATGLDEVNLSSFKVQFDGSEFFGTTTCRDYLGKYQTTNDHLKVTFLQMTTDFNCHEIDGRLESEYTTLLENVEQFNVSQSRLELYTRRGERLVFELEFDK